MSGSDFRQNRAKAEMTLGPVAEQGRGRSTALRGHVCCGQTAYCTIVGKKEEADIKSIHSVTQGENLERQEKCNSCFCHSPYIWLVANDLSKVI